MTLLRLPEGVLDLDASLRELDRMDAEESLYAFLQMAWRYIDPAPWTDGWVMEAVSEHLQAVCDGEIRRLIVNIPPRCAKSSLISVAFPAWGWAQRYDSPTSGPSVPFLHASYDMRLSLRDSVKCRRLIESPWYQELWGHRVKFAADQNQKTRFQNTAGGERLITSIGAGVTGEGGNVIVIDDPNAANEAFSEATIQATIDWWDGTMSTRHNDPKTGAFIIVQQRLAEDDLTGHILSKSVGEWTHLVLPMRFEPDRRFTTSIGWTDPRTEEGELLWPDRFGDDEVDNLTRALGPFAAAGQLQQRPEVKGGGVIPRDKWQLWPEGSYPPMDFIVASLDTAYTLKQENDYSALTVWGVFTNDSIMELGVGVSATAGGAGMAGARRRAESEAARYAEQTPRVMLMSAWQERLELHNLTNRVAKTCQAMKVDLLLIENKAAGISVAQEIRRLHGHEKWGVMLVDPKSQDKLARLYSVQHLFFEDMVYAPDRAWADMVITQVAGFPKMKHDDLVDTVSQALHHMRTVGLLQRAPERLAEIDDARQHRGGPDVPLYPV
jgi:predicted phage terminase large subunit-like protein